MTREQQLRDRAFRLHEDYLRVLRLCRGAATEEEIRQLRPILRDRAADCRAALDEFYAAQTDHALREGLRAAEGL